MGIDTEVVVSLAELQEGAMRRLVVQRTRLGPDAKPYSESKPITLPIRAGWQSGTKVTFRGEDNHTSTEKQPGDLVVLITERPFPSNNSSEIAAQRKVIECA